jgi:hypothetical protein
VTALSAAIVRKIRDWGISRAVNNSFMPCGIPLRTTEFSYGVRNTSQLLLQKMIAFVRRPGALDSIFGRLLDPKVDDDEVLAAAEILIYAGECYERPDEILPRLIGKRRC